MVPRFRLAASVALAIACSFAPVVARAQDASAIAHAREDFRRGMSLEAAGDWEGALALFRGVALVKSTPQVRFHIAQAEEHTGNLVAALGSYRLAAFEASEAKIKDVQVASERAIALIEPKLAKLTLNRGDGARVAKVVLDSRELGPATIGTPMAVNPGPHHIEASAPGRELVVVDLTLSAGEKKDVSLVLPVAKGAAAVAEAVKDDSPHPVDDKPAKTSRLKIAGFIVGGAGIASLGVAGAFLAIRQSDISKLDAACGPTKQACPANLASTNSGGQTASTIFTATVIAGGVLVAGGVTMIILAPSSKPRPTVGVALSPGFAGLTGSF